jgi:hypothetical protein
MLPVCLPEERRQSQCPCFSLLEKWCTLPTTWSQCTKSLYFKGGFEKDINLGVSTLGSWVLKKDPTPNMPDEDLKVGYLPLSSAWTGRECAARNLAHSIAS